MDNLHFIIDNLIQLGVFIVGLLTLYLMLKRENRRNNEKLFEKDLANIEKFHDLTERVKLLEQRVILFDGEIRKELEDIKKEICELRSQLQKSLINPKRGANES